MKKTLLAVMAGFLTVPAVAGEFGGSYTAALGGTGYGAINRGLNMNWPGPELQRANTFEVRYRSSVGSPWVLGVMYEDLRFRSDETTSSSDGSSERWLRTGTERSFGATLDYVFRRGHRLQPFIGGGIGAVRLTRHYNVTDSQSGALLRDYDNGQDPAGLWTRARTGVDIYVVPRHFYVRPALEFEDNFRYRLGVGFAF